jgi:HMG (high mobility group) box
MLKKARSTSPTVKKNKVLRWTWRKPKDKPKRPLSAYNIFFADVRQNLIDERLGFGSLARTVAEKWKNLDPILKEPYEHKAKLERENYNIELARWKQEQADKAKEEESHMLSVDESPGSLEEDSFMMPSLANMPSQRFWQTEGLDPSSPEAYSTSYHINQLHTQASHPTMHEDRPISEWSLEPRISALTTNNLDSFEQHISNFYPLGSSAPFDSSPEFPSCDHDSREYGSSEILDTRSYASLQPYETSCARLKPLPLHETLGASLEPVTLLEAPGASTTTSSQHCFSDKHGDHEVLYYTCPEDVRRRPTVDHLLSMLDQEECDLLVRRFSV